MNNDYGVFTFLSFSFSLHHTYVTQWHKSKTISSGYWQKNHFSCSVQLQQYAVESLLARWFVRFRTRCSVFVLRINQRMDETRNHKEYTQKRRSKFLSEKRNRVFCSTIIKSNSLRADGRKANENKIETKIFKVDEKYGSFVFKHLEKPHRIDKPSSIHLTTMKTKTATNGIARKFRPKTRAFYLFH